MNRDKFQRTTELILIEFPTVSESNEVSSRQFLDATRGVVKFVESLGLTFKPVKDDINGNLSMLEEIYESDVDQYSELANFYEEPHGRNALLWLARALKFINLFLDNFLDDYNTNTRSSGTTALFKIAYEESLQKYHSWLTRQVVNVCLNAAPNREKLLRCLTSKETVHEDEIFAELQVYLATLTSNVDFIDNLFGELEVNA